MIRIIHLTRGYVTVVDEWNYNWLSQFNWTLHGEGYAVSSTPPFRSMLMHRLITMAQKGQVCDHENLDRLYNRESNLRICGYTQNARNSSKKRPYQKFKGVFKQCGINPGNKYRAQIVVDYKAIHLGTFLNDVDAAIAYNNAATKYFGEFALLNKI